VFGDSVVDYSGFSPVFFFFSAFFLFRCGLGTLVLWKTFVVPSLLFSETLEEDEFSPVRRITISPVSSFSYPCSLIVI